MLWLREAHALHPPGNDLPPLLVKAPGSAETQVDDATQERWEQDWPAMWHAVAEHAGRENDPRLFDRLDETADGSPERRQLLEQMIGPNWGDRHGREVFDDPAHLRWTRDGENRHAASQRAALADTPERRDLDALVGAWQAGLTKIVTIPCQGEHAQKLGAHGLLITVDTRAVSDSYRRALSSFSSL